MSGARAWYNSLFMEKFGNIPNTSVEDETVKTNEPEDDGLGPLVRNLRFQGDLNALLKKKKEK